MEQLGQTQTDLGLVLPQERQSGLKSGGAQRGGEFRGIFTPKNLLIYILSGRGRKSGGARALLAPPRMAPLQNIEHQ